MTFFREFMDMVNEQAEIKVLRVLPRIILCSALPSWRWEYRLLHYSPMEE